MIADREPGKIEMYSRALASRGAQLVDAGKLVANLGGRAARAGLDLVAAGQLLNEGRKLLDRDPKVGAAKAASGGFKKKPHTRFDEKVSPHRVVDAVGFLLADCKTVREHVADVSINDIFLAACGGAVRLYLQAKQELPAASLVAVMPISTRGEVKDMDAGNQVAMAPVSLGSDIADPLARLLAVRRGARSAKGVAGALGLDFGAKLIQILPAAAESIITHGLMSLCNTTVSNVRGPNVPLFLAGAGLQVYLPVSIAFNGNGLNMTGFSYNGMLWVCFVSCRDMLPDPEFFRRCLNESFAEIVKAARKQPRLTGKPAKPVAKAVVARKPARRRAPKARA